MKINIQKNGKECGVSIIRNTHPCSVHAVFLVLDKENHTLKSVLRYSFEIKDKFEEEEVTANIIINEDNPLRDPYVDVCGKVYGIKIVDITKEFSALVDHAEDITESEV